MLRKTLHYFYKLKFIQIKSLSYLSHKRNHNLSNESTQLEGSKENENHKIDNINRSSDMIMQQNEILITQHKKMRIPFIEENFYKKLLDNLLMLPQENYLETADIIARYTILNNEHIEKEFLVQILVELSKRKYFDFEFWYFTEKRVIEIVNRFTNNQLAKVIYSYAMNDKGSNYLFNLLAKEVLDRKIRSFKHEEFFLIYEGFKTNKIKDKLLWAILERSKIECFSQDEK
jgi:hypothetical protein